MNVVEVPSPDVTVFFLPNTIDFENDLGETEQSSAPDSVGQ